jgi:hypothetical protein
MVYGRITDLTNIEDPNASPIMPCPSDCRRIDYPGHSFREIGSDVDVKDEIVITDTVPAKLLLAKKFEDGPEIFKRVRFISRWHDFEESRGDLIWSSGGFSCWGRAGPAIDPAYQLLNVWERYMDTYLVTMPPCDPFCIALALFFIGSNRQDSRPVLVLYTKKPCQAAVSLTRKWLRLNNLDSWLSLVLSSGGLFKDSTERDIANARRRMQLAGGSIHRE